MARCSECGADNAADARFCKHCGRMLDVSPGTSTPAAVPQPPRSGVSGPAVALGLMVVVIAAVPAGSWFVLSAKDEPAPPPLAAVPAPPPIAPTTLPPAAEPQPAPPPPVAAVDTAPPAAPAEAPSPSMPPPPPAIASQAATSAPTAPPPRPATRPRRPAEEPAQSAFFDDDAPPPPARYSSNRMNEPLLNRWDQMRQELWNCGDYNPRCQERVRQRYCAGNWGRVPECRF